MKLSLKKNTQSHLATLGLALCFLLSFFPNLNAQLSLTSVNSLAIDASSYPTLRWQVKATLNGSAFTLNAQNVLIQEDNLVSIPRSVTRINDSTFTVEWLTRNRSNNGLRARMICWNATQTASTGAISASGLGPSERIQQIRFRDVTSKQISFFHIDQLPANLKRTDTLQVLAISGRYVAQGSFEERRVRVDSITTQTPYFKIRWLGGIRLDPELPALIYASLPAYIAVDCAPPDNGYYRDVLTVHYDGGATERINLSVGVYPLAQRTNLNLITPNGGDTLYPCQRRTIKWRGADPTSPVIVEYSANGTQGPWNEIGRSTTDSLQWIVPDENSNTCLVRVRQLSESNVVFPLRTQNTSAVQKVRFSPNSKKILSAYNNSEIVEWDVLTRRILNRYALRSDIANTSFARFIALEYTSDSTFYAVYDSNAPRTQADSIAFFTSSNNLPVSSAECDALYRYKSAMYDSSRKQIVMVPREGATLGVFSSQDGRKIRAVPMPSIISAVGVSGGDSIVVALLNGDIEIYSPSSWNLITRMNFPSLGQIANAYYLADGKTVAFGGVASTSSIINPSIAELNLLDLSARQIVRTNRKNTTPLTVTASSTSRYVVYAFEGQPQAPLWDVVTNTLSQSTIIAIGSVPTDLCFSPDAQWFALASQAINEQVQLRAFIFPETDVSDRQFIISRASFSITTANFPRQYAFTRKDSVFTVNLCNNGLTPIPINGVGSLPFADPQNFILLDKPTPDTLQRGECMTLRLAFAPKDTGMLKTEFNTSTCASNFSMDIQGYSIPRSLSLPDTIDFDDICVGQPTEREFELIRNNDPVPLIVNSVESAPPFTILTSVKDDVLSPNGGSIRVRVRFVPQQIGVTTMSMNIYYGEQRTLFSKVVLRGRGAGTNLTPTVSPLAFIPEQRTRTIHISNKNKNVLTLTSLSLKPSTGFTLSPVTIPVVLQPGDSIPLTVTWDNLDSTSATIEGTIEPCSTPLVIPVMLYRATATISIPTVQADPNGNASIPINFTISENSRYGAERPFVAEFTVNPRMFLPTDIVVSQGKAEIVRNEIQDDKRIIGIRLLREFEGSGVVATVNGVAGLAETTESPITIVKQSLFWSQFVTTTATDGKMDMINLCNTRRILQPTSSLLLTGIAPNPINESATLIVESSAEQNVRYDIINTTTGEFVIRSGVIGIRKGSNSILISCTQLPTGSYTAVLHGIDVAVPTSTLLFSIVR
jgi:hypothetical protein